MRLSDAVVLGSSLMHLRPGKWDRCALGAAAVAVGSQPLYRKVVDQWPWLEANHEEHLLALLSMFDERVCAGTMSFESFVAHIRAVEPSCGVCCTRDCYCGRAEMALYAMTTPSRRSTSVALMDVL